MILTWRADRTVLRLEHSPRGMLFIIDGKVKGTRFHHEFEVDGPTYTEIRGALKKPDETREDGFL